MIAPTLEELASEREDFKICKVDVDQLPALASQYKIMSIPTLIVFKDGKAGAPAMGARPKQAILAQVENA
jgi:thioredoxin 1